MVKKRLKTKEIEVIGKNELLVLINQLDSLRNRALVCFLYLTGARISEVVRQVRKYQLEFVEKNGVKFLLINGITTLKRRDKLKRNIPINIKREKPFIDILTKYVNTLNNEAILFNICRSRAFQILDEVMLYPHLLRHYRLSHLMTLYDLPTEYLQRFTGWKSMRQTEVYVHLKWQDIAERMI